jgi:hypothetical protein
MIRAMFGVFVGAVSLIWMVFFVGPDLWRDYQLRNARLVPANDVSIEKAECTTIWFIFSNCSVTYSSNKQRVEKSSLRYALLGPAPEGRVQLMRLPSDQNVIATDIGMSHLTNRIIFFVVYVASLNVGIYFIALRAANV